MIIAKASILSAEFGTTSTAAKLSVARLFVKAHSLMYRMGMHKSHCLLEEVAQEALEYMAVVQNLVISPHPHQHWIINMDQMPTTSQ